MVPGLRPHSPPPPSYHSIDRLRHAALPPLSPLLATVFTDSVIYIYCDTTGYSLSTHCIFFVLFAEIYGHYIVDEVFLPVNVK